MESDELEPYVALKDLCTDIAQTLDLCTDIEIHPHYKDMNPDIVNGCSRLKKHNP